MSAELARRWYKEYYAKVLNSDWDDGVPLRGSIQLSEEYLDKIGAQARQKADENLAYAKRVLQATNPDVLDKLRELMSVLMSAVNREYVMVASREQLSNATGLHENEVQIALIELECKGLIRRIIHGQGRVEDIG